MKTVSFDIWGTLLKSNPQFKEAQGRLVTSFTGKSPEEFLKLKSEMKKVLDKQVEEKGIQPDRFKNYKKLLPGLTLKELKAFIECSDKLFLKYPPQIYEEGRKLLEHYRSLGYTILISSNTVFIYGDTLGKVIWDTFEIPMKNCNFSDIVGVSKPNASMFNFKVKPEFHVGDNVITDGACKEVNINFINVNNANI
jgi:putative hydrolase of the HAD superfamily